MNCNTRSCWKNPIEMDHLSGHPNLCLKPWRTAKCSQRWLSWKKKHDKHLWKIGESHPKYRVQAREWNTKHFNIFPRLTSSSPLLWVWNGLTDVSRPYGLLSGPGRISNISTKELMMASQWMSIFECLAFSRQAVSFGCDATGEDMSLEYIGICTITDYMII